MKLISNIFETSHYLRKPHKDYNGKPRNTGDSLILPKKKSKKKKKKIRIKVDHSEHEMLILPGKGPHAGQLKCKECNSHIQWLSAKAYADLTRTFYYQFL